MRSSARRNFVASVADCAKLSPFTALSAGRPLGSLGGAPIAQGSRCPWSNPIPNAPAFSRSNLSPRGLGNERGVTYGNASSPTILSTTRASRVSVVHRVPAHPSQTVIHDPDAGGGRTKVSANVAFIDPDLSQPQLCSRMGATMPTETPALNHGGPLLTPYGGQLVDRFVPASERKVTLEYAKTLPSVTLSDRSVLDLTLLAVGAFSPLDRFMGREDYAAVLESMRLANGTLFPVPLTLPVQLESKTSLYRDIALRTPHHDVIGIVTLTEIFEADPALEAEAFLGTRDARHPLVAELKTWPRTRITGEFRLLKQPRLPFSILTRTPAETRGELSRRGRPNVIAFQTRNPLHRAHEELLRRAARAVDGTLLLHPVSGLTKPGDIDALTRVRTYRALVDHYFEPEEILLSLLPLAMRFAGPKEALWHAIIRRNYGANHLIVGRDHASPGIDSKGEPYWGPYDAQELVQAHAAETGVTPINFESLHYVPSRRGYFEASEIPDGEERWSISGTEVREEYLARGRTLPEWFTRPEVAKILQDSEPPSHQSGVCIWFTGLSGAGKSTTAEALALRLTERGRRVSLLDGDVVRQNLSRGLGFSKQDRDLNVRRIGYVASEVVLHGGIAICAAVSPYRESRDAVRSFFGADRFIEVFIDTPLEVCESRDKKGLYAKARRGEIEQFTGISDPYEAPLEAELTLETTDHEVEANVDRIIAWLEARGFLLEEVSLVNR